MMTDSAPNAASLAPAFLLVLMTTFVLFLTILLGSFVLIRAFRRRRQALKREPHIPTEHVDAWLLHKPPEAHDDDNDYEDDRDD